MSDTTPKCVLSIDVGSSGPKISVVDDNGDILATRSGKFETIYHENAAGVEQDPNEMWDQVLRLSKEVIDECGMAKNIVAIGNCSQYFSSIPVDKEGNATYNMIMWEDSRASKHISKLMGGFPQYLGYNLFKLARWLISVGVPPIIQGIGASSHMVWLKEERPEVWKKTYKVMEPSDYISLKLTGKFQTNENVGFTYTMIKKAAWSKGTYNVNLINALGLDPKKYPDILPVCDNLGTPKQEIIDYLGLNDNVTVFGGMQDTTACMLGGAAFDDYDAVIEIGTTLNTGVVVPERII
ncbi:FGGY family carbohydrate kinase, partial [Flavobacteriales bacterium]|nr:FGGY family carbohydrate kinase [Flavobacteriales bacterium]